MLSLVKEIFHGVDILALATFGVGIILFLIFFIFGVYFFRKKILSVLCFLIAFSFLFSIPFVLAFSSQNFFYKIEILENNSKPLFYSDSFLIDIKFKNQGKLAFKKCLVAIEPQRKNESLKNKILNFLEPLDRYQYMIEQEIQVSQIYDIHTIINYNFKEYPYKLTLDCR